MCGSKLFEWVTTRSGPYRKWKFRTAESTKRLSRRPEVTKTSPTAKPRRRSPLKATCSPPRANKYHGQSRDPASVGAEQEIFDSELFCRGSSAPSGRTKQTGRRWQRHHERHPSVHGTTHDQPQVRCRRSRGTSRNRHCCGTRECLVQTTVQRKDCRGPPKPSCIQDCTHHRRHLRGVAFLFTCKS